MKKVRLAVIFFLIHSAISSPLFSQKIITAELNPVSRRFDNFPVMGGEANQSSTTLLFDKKGFLWSGTETALYRFDGEKYIEYRNNSVDSSGYSGIQVSALLEDSDGYLWVGTSGALNRLDINSGYFTHYYPDTSGNPGPNNIIKLIREDDDGLLWILTNGNIFSFDRKKNKFTEYKTDILSWRPVYDTYGEEPEHFLIDRQGNKWFATRCGLYRFTSSTEEFSRVFPDSLLSKERNNNSIRCLTEDNSGNVWFGTLDGELYKWKPGDRRPEKIEYAPAGEYRYLYYTVSAINSDRNGLIWIFGDNTFSIYDPVSRISRSYLISLNLENNFLHRASPNFVKSSFKVLIGDSFFHKDGSVWFFNRGMGLMFRFDHNVEKLSLYRVPNFMVYRCLMDETGAFWFACIRNNIFRLTINNIPYSTLSIANNSDANSGSTAKIVADTVGRIWMMLSERIDTLSNLDGYSAPGINSFNLSEKDGYVSIFIDRKNRLWFGGQNGQVTCYNQETGSMITYKLPGRLVDMKIERISKICEDREANILAIAYSCGLYRLDENNGEFRHIFDYGELPGKPALQLSDFLVDRNGDFWILNYFGVYRLKMPEMKIFDYSNTSVENNLVAGLYSRIREDKNGNIWLLNTNTGLYSYNRQSDSFSRVEITKNKNGSFYFDLLADSLNRLWIANDAGITIFDPVDGNSRTVKMPRLQFDVQGYQVPGHILYINERSLYIFDMEVKGNSLIPPVYITSLKINGKEYNRLYPGKEDARSLKNTDLLYTQNSLQFEFAAINYINPQNNSYRYFMKGFDDDTVFAGGANTAEYKKMRPGNYTFWVSGSNNDGIWNREGVKLDIHIHPPFYRTIVAYVIYFLFFLTAVLGYIRLRISNIKRENLKLEAEVKLRTGELEIKNRQLQNIDKIKTRFFTDISHEIRTPLSLILGPLESILNENHFDEKTDSILEMMKRNGQRLMQLMNQMLDISRLDSGKMKISLSESDITTFLKILVYEFVSFAESRGIRYLVELPDKPFITCFDKDKTEKIITNLLTNAFKFTEKGGTVSCKVKIVLNDQTKKYPQLVVSVEDTGQGIARENIQMIFDRFYRVEEDGKLVRSGSGIGLSLTRDLIDLIHGKIDVVSEKGKGSVFEVILPLGKDHLSAEEYIMSEQTIPVEDEQDFRKFREFESISNHFNHEPGKFRILVIEDNDDLRHYITESLEKEYTVTNAENGKSGLNLGLTLIPDLIITDIMMNDMDGLTICSRLKNDERTSHIPIIVLTARATPEDKISGLKTGADDYIIKPFNLSELTARISNLLNQREILKSKYRLNHGFDVTEMEIESVDDRFMRKVIAIINENLKDFAFDCRSLQEQLGMSRMHLFRKLKVLTGMPPVILIRNIRLERAAALISHKSGNITEIANSVGISNPSYFAKCFREYFGVSPKDYQNAGKENKKH